MIHSTNFLMLEGMGVAPATTIATRTSTTILSYANETRRSRDHRRVEGPSCSTYHSAPSHGSAASVSVVRAISTRMGAIDECTELLTISFMSRSTPCHSPSSKPPSVVSGDPSTASQLVGDSGS
jgi:hypothetical protein